MSYRTIHEAATPSGRQPRACRPPINRRCCLHGGRGTFGVMSHPGPGARRRGLAGGGVIDARRTRQRRRACSAVTSVAVIGIATAGPEIAARDKHRRRQSGRRRIELSPIVLRNRGK